jgi:hypothetical protein
LRADFGVFDLLSLWRIQYQLSAKFRNLEHRAQAYAQATPPNPAGRS